MFNFQLSIFNYGVSNLVLPRFMQVHRSTNNLPAFKNAVITIGTFDGVHTGHLQIIKQLKEEAKKAKGESVIITFHPHPRMIIVSDKSEIKLLNTLEEKIELLSAQSVDHLVIVPFTKQFSEQTAEEYINDFLITGFHPHTLITGYDHHFGKDRKGNYKMLEAYADKGNYFVKEISEHVLNQVTVSSTKIRKAVLECDIETANEYLGYNYFFEGTVTEGNKIGRTIGYPTANLKVNDENKLIPGDGIYAVKVAMVKNQSSYQNQASHPVLLNGMMSIGIRPTIGNSERSIEVNIFEFNEDIYGQNIRVYVKYFLREEKKFDGLDELKSAIDKDKIMSVELLLNDQV